jgi:RNA polymerase-binding protein
MPPAASRAHLGRRHCGLRGDATGGRRRSRPGSIVNGTRWHEVMAAEALGATLARSGLFPASGCSRVTQSATGGVTRHDLPSHTGGRSFHRVVGSWDRHMPSGLGLRQRRPQAHLAGPGEFMIVPRQWRSRPGASAGVAERPGAQPASRQQAAYRCARGHAFTVALAAGVEPPVTWGCRCGAPARPAGGTDPGSGRTERDRCMALLLRRRTRAELEQLLAERLADTAQQRDRPVHLAR